MGPPSFALEWMMLLATINILNKKAAHLRNNLPSGNTSLYWKEAWQYSTSDTPWEEKWLASEISSAGLYRWTRKPNFNVRCLWPGSKFSLLPAPLPCVPLLQHAVATLVWNNLTCNNTGKDVSSRHMICDIFSSRNADIQWSLSPLPHGTGGCMAETTVAISCLTQPELKAGVLPQDYSFHVNRGETSAAAAHTEAVHFRGKEDVRLQNC